MKRRLRGLISLCLGLAFVLVLVAPLAAQKKDEKVKPAQYTGRITVLNKATSSITIQGKTGVIEIAYDNKTKFTYLNKPGTIDDVKEGRRAVCLVNPAEKGKMVATRIDIREGK